MSTDHIPSDEERGIPTYKERVAKAFLASMHANDTGLSQDQIRAIQILCSDWDFCLAVQAYLNTVTPHLHPEKPVSPDTLQI